MLLKLVKIKRNKTHPEISSSAIHNLEKLSQHLCIRGCSKCNAATLQFNESILDSDGDVGWVKQERYRCYRCNTLWEVAKPKDVEVESES